MIPLLRYAAVGSAATAVHYALLVLAVERLGMPPAWAAASGAVIGAQVAYVGNRRITFAHRGPWWPSWWRFQLVALMGAAISAALVGAGVRLGAHYLVAQALATVVAMLATYALNRRHAFA